MTGEGGASSGSWARIICKWVQQGGHQRWTICLSTTHHSPCQPCSKSDNLGVVAALFNNGMIANYNPLCIHRQTGAIREEEGVVYNASLSLRKRMRTIFHKLWRAEQTIWAGKVRVGLEGLVWEVHLFALCLSATCFSITLCCLVEQKQLKYIINQRWGFVSTVANNGWVTYRSSYKMLKQKWQTSRKNEDVAFDEYCPEPKITQAVPGYAEGWPNRWFVVWLGVGDKSFFSISIIFR